MIAGVASMCACFFTNPLEVIKTRFQLQGELKQFGHYTRPYRNIFHATYQIVTHDKIRTLQNGLAPALIAQFIQNSIRLGGFQAVKESGIITDTNDKIIFHKSFFATGGLGMVGHLLANPFFLIKTQNQAMAVDAIAVGYQHESTSLFKALFNIVQTQGLKGMFRGGGAAMPRAFACSTSQLLGFTYGKQWALHYNYFKDKPLLTTLVGSLFGGILISICITPFDLIMTRLYNQGMNADGKGMYYNSYMDCVLKIYKTEGISAYYKGIGPMYLRLGPHAVLLFMFWEMFKNAYDKLEYNQTDIHEQFVKKPNIFFNNRKLNVFTNNSTDSSEDKDEKHKQTMPRWND